MAGSLMVKRPFVNGDSRPVNVKEYERMAMEYSPLAGDVSRKYQDTKIHYLEVSSD